MTTPRRREASPGRRFGEPQSRPGAADDARGTTTAGTTSALAGVGGRRGGEAAPPQESSDRVAARLATDAARLWAQWVPQTSHQQRVRTRMQGFLAEHGEASVRRSLRAGHLTASAVVLDARGEQVLLTLHALAGHWLQLGGHLEAGDRSLAEAASREVAEESGIPRVVVDPVPLDLDWHRVRCRDTSGTPGPSAHLDTTFLAVAPVAAGHRISEESLDLRWFAVESLPDETDATVRRCVRAAVQRLQPGAGDGDRDDGTSPDLR